MLLVDKYAHLTDEVQAIIKTDYGQRSCTDIAEMLNQRGLPGPFRTKWRLWDVTAAARRMKLTWKYTRINSPPSVPCRQNVAGDSFASKVVGKIGFEVAYDHDSDWDDNLGFSPYRGPVDGWPK